MKKRLIGIVLTIAMALTVFSGTAALAAGSSASMSNFKTRVTYSVSTFTDVGSGKWYDFAVQKSVELGIMNGKGGSVFEPDGKIRICEAIKMACVVHNIYNGGTAIFAQDAQPWYQPYVDYAIDKHILGNLGITDFNAYIDRDIMAYYFSRALPESELAAINDVETLPDVNSADIVGTPVFKLYRAGVLTGSDSYGTFAPNSKITRAEAAAIIMRLAVPSERKHFVLNTVQMTSEKLQRLTILRDRYYTTERLHNGFNSVDFGDAATAYFYNNGLVLLEEYAVFDPDIDEYAVGSYNKYWYYSNGEVYCILMVDPNTGIHTCTLFFDDGKLLAWTNSEGVDQYTGCRWNEMQGYYAYAKAQCDDVASRY